MVFGVPYAYDRIVEGQTEGGSIARCRSLIRALRDEISLFSHPIFILSAGYEKSSPLLPTASVAVPICDQMSSYLIQTLGVSSDDIKSNPEAWGTYQETLAAIRQIEYSVDDMDDVTVLVCTNPGHMPRVKMCWHFLAPSDWEIEFVPASHSFGSIKERLQETAKFFNYLYRFVAKKW